MTSGCESYGAIKLFENITKIQVQNNSSICSIIITTIHYCCRPISMETEDIIYSDQGLLSSGKYILNVIPDENKLSLLLISWEILINWR